MIHAEIAPQSGNVLLVRFSNPNEEFGNKPFQKVNSKEEVNRMLYFQNRTYVVLTMKAWLKQRNHAVNYSSTQIVKLIGFMENIEKNSFQYVCMVIGRFREDFESIAPSAKSRCFPYYQKNIVPILDFCKSK